MEIEKDKMVTLNEDDKAVSLKSLSDLFYAVKQLYDWIKEDGLSEEMKNILFSLIESRTAEASNLLGYNSKAKESIDERYKDIRQYNQEIHALKKQLAENTQIAGLTELLYEMHQALYRWWNSYGFDLITDDNFGSYGYKGRFCLGVRMLSFAARKPVTEKNKRQNQFEQMIKDGFEFEKEDSDYVLLDTQVNRDKITALVKGKFPSIEIIKWRNFVIYKKEKFQLRDFEAYIRDLSDLKALMEEINQTQDDNEE